MKTLFDPYNNPEILNFFTFKVLNPFENLAMHIPGFRFLNQAINSFKSDEKFGEIGGEPIQYDDCEGLLVNRHFNFNYAIVDDLLHFGTIHIMNKTDIPTSEILTLIFHNLIVNRSLKGGFKLTAEARPLIISNTDYTSVNKSTSTSLLKQYLPVKIDPLFQHSIIQSTFEKSKTDHIKFMYQLRNQLTLNISNLVIIDSLDYLFKELDVSNIDDQMILINRLGILSKSFVSPILIHDDYGLPVGEIADSLWEFSTNKMHNKNELIWKISKDEKVTEVKLN